MGRIRVSTLKIITILVILGVFIFDIVIVPFLKKIPKHNSLTNANDFEQVIKNATVIGQTQSNPQMTIELQYVLAEKYNIFVFIRIQGLLNNDIKKYLEECKIIDADSNVWSFANQTKSISSVETVSVVKPIKKIAGLAENELILEFINGMEKESIVSIEFNFGSYGYFVFENITINPVNIEERVYTGKELQFDLPNAHCEIIKITHASLGTYFTIKWYLQDGFTSSTRNEYPQYHIKFTYGNKERYTFLILPDFWMGDNTVVISEFYLEEIISPKDEICMDLYLNDDKTYIRRLAIAPPQ